MRDRLISPSGPARNRSSRQPACASSTTARRGLSPSEDLVSDIDTPADPKSTFSYRAAKLAVIVLSALIILALIGLVVGAALKFTGRSKPVFAASGAAFVLPPAAKIVSPETQPGRL